MASPQAWIELLSWLKTAFDVWRTGADVYDSYRRHKSEQDTINEAARVSAVFSTYTDEEIEAWADRIRGCIERAKEQGGGADRVRCICSVLNQIRIGNGGDLPEIDDWHRIYTQLKCVIPEGRG